MLSCFKDGPEPHPGPAPGNEDHARQFRTGETTVMASAGRCQGQSNFDVFTLRVTVPNESEADRVFDALADGGKIEMPLKNAFWSPKCWMLEDLFGLGWMVSVASSRL